LIVTRRNTVSGTWTSAPSPRMTLAMAVTAESNVAAIRGTPR